MDYDRKIKIAKDREYPVRKSNEIIQRAKYDLSTVELKAFAFILSKILPSDTELKEIEFSVQDFCRACGIDDESGRNYSRIKDTLKGLRDKSFWLMNEKGVESTVGWLSKARINKGSGKIKVKLDEDLEQYLIGVFNNFTQYELISILPMKSSYSIRIYELLKSYAFTGKHEFGLDDLKSKLTASHYVNFKDFRKKVLEVATEEINRYTDIEISWTPIQTGRKVSSVYFEIKQRKTMERYKAHTRGARQLDGQMTLLDYAD